MGRMGIGDGEDVIGGDADDKKQCNWENGLEIIRECRGDGKDGKKWRNIRTVGNGLIRW